MVGISDLITNLGEHFWLVVFGGAEVFLAVWLFFAIHFTRRKPDGRVKPSQTRSSEKQFLQLISRDKERAYVLMRRSDGMPVGATDNLEEVLGVTLEHLRKDVTCIKQVLKRPEQWHALCKKYSESKEDDCFQAEFQRSNDQWIKVKLLRERNSEYSLFCFEMNTEYHKMVDSYEEKMRHTEEESKSKTAFLSRMSHEIRTPMNGIIGMLTLAKTKEEPDSPVVSYLERAEDLSQHMLSLINDILDMSRIEAGKVELEKASFNIHVLGTKIYDMFAKQLETKGVHYGVYYEDMTEENLIGDELRLSQVIINFLSNAAKFTKEGEVTVTFKQMMITGNIVDLMVRVHDTGVGMDTEFIKHIFRPFEQESIETAKKYGGTGLGMAITDQLVKLMGGEIVVKSVKGEGSDFIVYLHLPVAEQTTQVEEIAKAEDETVYDHAFVGKHILMAEDNEVNAMIAVEILESMGATIEVVENGKDAVDRFAANIPGYYDFILMDVQMPVMDGRTAAKTIRAMDREDAEQIPIFALSADAFVEDERLSFESGLNGHFAKPLDFTLLQRKIGKFLGGGYRRTPRHYSRL